MQIEVRYEFISYGGGRYEIHRVVGRTDITQGFSSQNVLSTALVGRFDNYDEAQEIADILRKNDVDVRASQEELKRAAVQQARIAQVLGKSKTSDKGGLIDVEG